MTSVLPDTECAHAILHVSFQVGRHVTKPVYLLARNGLDHSLNSIATFDLLLTRILYVTYDLVKYLVGCCLNRDVK